MQLPTPPTFVPHRLNRTQMGKALFCGDTVRANVHAAMKIVRVCEQVQFCMTDPNPSK